MVKHLKNNLLFFDDDCILCNKSIRFIHFLDSKKIIYFTPLQSEFGIEIQKQIKVTALISTVVYYRKDKFYTQSSAIIHCISNINWYYKPILILLLIPPFIRNGLYNFIAQNRKKFFLNQSCNIPSESLLKQIVGK